MISNAVLQSWGLTNTSFDWGNPYLQNKLKLKTAPTPKVRLCLPKTSLTSILFILFTALTAVPVTALLPQDLASPQRRLTSDAAPLSCQWPGVPPPKVSTLGLYPPAADSTSNSSPPTYVRRITARVVNDNGIKVNYHKQGASGLVVVRYHVF